MGKNKEMVAEGVLRSEELSKYLTEMNAPKQIWLSEDASGIISRVSYHSPSNNLVGLVLPLDENGMPIRDSFIPTNVAEIQQQMNSPLSTLVYLVMAQPMKKDIPPFVLTVFGTNNTFKAADIMRRWQYIVSELSK